MRLLDFFKPKNEPKDGFLPTPKSAIAVDVYRH